MSYWDIHVYFNLIFLHTVDSHKPGSILLYYLQSDKCSHPCCYYHCYLVFLRCLSTEVTSKEFSTEVFIWNIGLTWLRCEEHHCNKLYKVTFFFLSFLQITGGAEKTLFLNLTEWPNIRNYRIQIHTFCRDVKNTITQNYIK